MAIHIDQSTSCLFLGLLALLGLSSVLGAVFKRVLKGEKQAQIIANLNARIKGWWVMSFIFAFALLTGGIGSIILFGFISFFALREFITLTPTKRGDHRALFWAFFVILPLQYYLIGVKWYVMYTIFIPVYAFIFLPIRIAIAGDYERFLERTSKIQWGLMLS